MEHTCPTLLAPMFLARAASLENVKNLIRSLSTHVFAALSCSGYYAVFGCRRNPVHRGSLRGSAIYRNHCGRVLARRHRTTPTGSTHYHTVSRAATPLPTRTPPHPKPHHRSVPVSASNNRYEGRKKTTRTERAIPRGHGTRNVVFFPFVFFIFIAFAN